jgi:hypothetical protein
VKAGLRDGAFVVHIVVSTTVGQDREEAVDDQEVEEPIDAHVLSQPTLSENKENSINGDKVTPKATS